MNKHLATVERKNSILKGRRLREIIHLPQQKYLLDSNGSVYEATPSAPLALSLFPSLFIYQEVITWKVKVLLIPHESDWF